MRTLVDIPERQLEELNLIARSDNLSRSELVRQAIEAFIRTRKASLNEAFGAWGDRQVDGLEYQEKLRSEW